MRLWRNYNPCSLLVEVENGNSRVFLKKLNLEYTLSGQIIMIPECIIIWPLSIYIYIRGLLPEFVHGWGPATWPWGRDMGGWLDCLMVKHLVEGTICILAFYYIGYTLSGQIIMHSGIIIIWPLSVYSHLIEHQVQVLSG